MKKKLKTKSNHQKTNNSVNRPSVKNNTELIDWMIKQKITKKLIKNNKKIITKIIERKKTQNSEKKWIKTSLNYTHYVKMSLNSSLTFLEL